MSTRNTYKTNFSGDKQFARAKLFQLSWAPLASTKSTENATTISYVPLPVHELAEWGSELVDVGQVVRDAHRRCRRLVVVE
jgi:hypothetical protein